MEADLRHHKRAVAQMKAELAYYRNKYPGENPEPAFDIASSPDDSLDTICPAQTSAEFPSPMSMDSMDSPCESSYQPETPASNALAMPEIDSTQYPAAILCDLQCRSISRLASSSMAAICLYLSLFNLTLHSMKSLVSLMTSSTSTSSQKAAQQLLLRNPMLAWLILPSISSAQPSSATTLPQSLAAFLTALKQTTLTCRVPLAQHLLATRLSQRSSSIKDVSRPSEGMKKQVGSVDGVLRLRLMRSGRRRQIGRRKGARALKQDFQHSMRFLGRQNTGCGFKRR